MSFFLSVISTILNSLQVHLTNDQYSTHESRSKIFGQILTRLLRLCLNLTVLVIKEKKNTKNTLYRSVTLCEPSRTLKTLPHACDMCKR